jgi:hypothetical protein
VRAHGTPVHLLEEVADGPVELSQRKEGLVVESGEDPPLDHLCHLIVGGKILIGDIKVGLIAAGVSHPTLEVVGDQNLADATKELSARYGAL